MMTVLVLEGIIWAIWNLGIWVIHKFDRPKWILRSKERWLIIACGIGNAMIIGQVCEGNKLLEICMAVLGGCLLFACITDCKTYEVYQFIWWLGGAVSCAILLRMSSAAEGVSWQALGKLMFFCLLQEVFFSRFYGRADCHGFVVCAAASCGMGMGLQEWLNHMLLAFLGAAVMQLLRGNVNKYGNLKQPIAFLPYITIAFWINLYCFSLRKMVY